MILFYSAGCRIRILENALRWVLRHFRTDRVREKFIALGHQSTRRYPRKESFPLAPRRVGITGILHDQGKCSLRNGNWRACQCKKMIFNRHLSKLLCFRENGCRLRAKMCNLTSTASILSSAPEWSTRAAPKSPSSHCPTCTACFSSRSTTTASDTRRSTIRCKCLSAHCDTISTNASSQPPTPITFPHFQWWLEFFCSLLPFSITRIRKPKRNRPQSKMPRLLLSYSQIRA